MSFSIRIIELTKPEVIAKLNEELEKPEHQFAHNHDVEAIKKIAKTYLDLLAEPNNQKVELNIGGSVVYGNESADKDFLTASLAVSANLIYIPE